MKQDTSVKYLQKKFLPRMCMCAYVHGCCISIIQSLEEKIVRSGKGGGGNGTT